MPSPQLLITGIKDGVGCFSQRYIGGIIGREVVAQLPNAAQQGYVRIALGREPRKSGQKLFTAMRVDSLARNQICRERSLLPHQL